MQIKRTNEPKHSDDGKGTLCVFGDENLLVQENTYKLDKKTHTNLKVKIKPMVGFVPLVST